MPLGLSILIGAVDVRAESFAGDSSGLDRGELFAKRQSDPAVAKFEALMDNTKSVWNRLGAFDASRWSHTLDLLALRCNGIAHIFFHQMMDAAIGDALAAIYALTKPWLTFVLTMHAAAAGYLPLNLGRDGAENYAAGSLTVAIRLWCRPTNRIQTIDVHAPDFDLIRQVLPSVAGLWLRMSRPMVITVPFRRA